MFVSSPFVDIWAAFSKNSLMFLLQIYNTNGASPPHVTQSMTHGETLKTEPGSCSTIVESFKSKWNGKNYTSHHTTLFALPVSSVETSCRPIVKFTDVSM